MPINPGDTIASGVDGVAVPAVPVLQKGWTAISPSYGGGMNFIAFISGPVNSQIYSI